jgi:hypothetical protein
VVGGLHKCLTCVKVDTKFSLCFENLTLHDCTINDGRCNRGHEASLDHQQLSMEEDNLFVFHVEISQTTIFLMCPSYHCKAFNEYGYIVVAIVAIPWPIQWSIVKYLIIKKNQFDI